MECFCSTDDPIGAKRLLVVLGRLESSQEQRERETNLIVAVEKDIKTGTFLTSDVVTSSAGGWFNRADFVLAMLMLKLIMLMLIQSAELPNLPSHHVT